MDRYVSRSEYQGVIHGLTKYTALGSGYLDSLRKPNVEAITKPISRFSKKGIVTSDGMSAGLYPGLKFCL
jgi:hypothetical protein